MVPDHQGVVMGLDARRAGENGVDEFEVIEFDAEFIANLMREHPDWICPEELLKAVLRDLVDELSQGNNTKP
jgi:hypothetical protein